VKHFPARFKYFPLGILVLFFVLASSVFAVGKPSDVGAQSTTGQDNKQQAQNRLTEAKLRACQAREDAIKKRASHITQLATNMEDKFDKHAQKVEEYYTSKVVPSGKTVANYDSLVADIDAKKAAVAAALSTAQNDANNFSCTGDDPKGQLTQFRKDMQAVKKALKDYRTSIKNLIVAVRSVTGATEREDKGSPKPASSPGGSE
jgi:peptidoglycan hydrolase CwlO-like protein